MAAKSTVYLSDRTRSVLGDEVSRRLNTVVGNRYDHLVRGCLPELSDPQWCAVFDANNGTIMDDDAIISGDGPGFGPDAIRSGMWANVSDSPGLGEKWNIDQRTLILSMQAWTPAQAVAAAEACQTFWMHCDLETPAAMNLALRRKP